MSRPVEAFLPGGLDGQQAQKLARFPLDLLHAPDPLPPQFTGLFRKAQENPEDVRAQGGFDFEGKKQSVRWVTEIEAALRTYIFRVFLSFAEEACELGRQGVWGVEQVEREAREFFAPADHRGRRGERLRPVGTCATTPHGWGTGVGRSCRKSSGNLRNLRSGGALPMSCSR